MDIGSGDNDPQNKVNANTRLSPTDHIANNTIEVPHQHSPDSVGGCAVPLHPGQQTGFLHHRSILQHVYGSRALLDGLREGAALSVDSKNAFPTMSHEMVAAALGLMCIPFLYIRPIPHLLRAPYLYSVGKGYVPRVYHHPRARTRQRDPLSPALFSLVASFVIFPLQDLDPGLTFILYADDLIFFLDGQANPQLLGRIWKVVSCFGQLSGLKVNLNKTAAIVRNCGGMEWARCFGNIGMDVKNFVKYLGVRLGNIRHHQDDQGWRLQIEQAFAPTLQEAFRRARVVPTVQLLMDERAFMLASWILPVVAWVFKAYYAPTPVIRQLKLVYHVTMGTNSWEITLPILSRPRTHGGLALPEPELFLMHQAAAPFVSLLGEPHKYPNKAVETFYAWATTMGFTPTKDNLPHIQLGMVQHAMVECCMFKAAAVVIQHYYGPMEIGNGKSLVREMMKSDEQEWLLNTDQGWAMWSARSDHWRHRCEVKAGASPVFTSYLMTWLRELCEWIGFYSGGRREQWRGFKQSLEQLRDTGV